MRGRIGEEAAAAVPSRYARLKRRVYHVLWITDPEDREGRVFGLFIMALIVLNVLAVILETVHSLYAKYEPVFFYFEVGSIAVFSVEYVLRLWCCTADERYARPVVGRLRYAVTPLALIDLVAIAPFYLPFFLPLRRVDTTFVRALRLFRLMRMFKFTRYNHSMLLIGRVLRKKKEDMVVGALVVLVLLVLLSSLMFFVEHAAQPSKFSSIPAAMWWGVSALTTVGYGDMVPMTAMGKVIGAVVAVLGIGLFALPAGILAAGFAEEVKEARGGRKQCPHCGREID